MEADLELGRRWAASRGKRPSTDGTIWWFKRTGHSYVESEQLPDAVFAVMQFGRLTATPAISYNTEDAAFTAVGAAIRECRAACEIRDEADRKIPGEDVGGF